MDNKENEILELEDSELLNQDLGRKERLEETKIKHIYTRGGKDSSLKVTDWYTRIRT